MTCGLWMLVVTFTPLLSWWTRWLAGPWTDPSGEVMIVLGNAVIDDGMIGESSYWRSVYAVRAWREGGFRKIIVSGDIGAPMRDFLIYEGVPPPAVAWESRSTSTRENAIYTAALVKDLPGKKVLLTSDYHMYRASRAFAKAGVEVLPRPFPDAGKRANRLAARWTVFFDLLEESAKIVYYRVRGWI